MNRDFGSTVLSMANPLRARDQTEGFRVGTSIIVRDIDPSDKSWLRREARRTGVSMAGLVRRLIHEKRTKTERCPKPSETFARYFGEDSWRRTSSPDPLRLQTAAILR